MCKQWSRLQLSLISILLCNTARAILPITESLWPAGPGGQDRPDPNLSACVTFYVPDPNNAIGTAVVVCPGGGYTHLAMDHEGQQVAAWLNRIGVLAVVLRYRHNGLGFKHPAPLQDAQRAIRLTRYRAESLGIKQNRIGILGFSAGGHLASTVGTHFAEHNQVLGDPVDRVSSRPDFMILIYPVITLYEPYCHTGSKRNLLGDRPDPDLVAYLSSERQVDSNTPPTFLVHGSGDKAVPVENSILFFETLRKAGVKAEMHIFTDDRHGFGLGAGTPAGQWPGLCEVWMRAMGMLPVGGR